MSRRTVALASFMAALAPFALGQMMAQGPSSSLRPPTAPDAVLVDCGPDAFTQSASFVPTTGGSAACVTQDANLYHLENSWWRSFPLYDSGVEADFNVCAVDFAVEESTSPGSGLQPLTVNVYENTGCPFPNGSLTLIAFATVNIADQSLGNVTVPVGGYVPAGGELVVELHVPTGVAEMRRFWIGGNGAGQSAPNWVSSASCSLPDPTDVASIGFPDAHLIMRVIGLEGGFAPKEVVLTGAPTGMLEPGVATTLDPSWKNQSGDAHPLTGLASDLVAPAGYTGQLLDAAADYGTVADGATADCAASTGDCYQIQIDGASGTGHRDATLTETLLFNAIVAGGSVERIRTLHIGHTFPDVADTSIFYKFIETIRHLGITGGCAGGGYCPTDTTLRQQMAVFLLKAVEGECYQPPAATGVFDDVPVSNPFAAFVEELAARGITGGCGPDLFCPTAPIKRKQMAVFLLKALLGSAYVPPVATHIFSDVTPGDPFEPWIEDLFNRQIAAGCGPGIFCPENPVNRGQMAPFLVKTFGLVLYAP